MFFGQKESKTNDLMQQHIHKVQETLDLFEELIEAYLGGESDFTDLSLAVHDKEHEADEARREVENNLYEGAFMPVFREDYFVFTELVDQVADRAETCADMIGQQDPEIPEIFQSDLKELTHEVTQSFDSLEGVPELLESGSKDEIRERVRDIGSDEEAVDKLEWNLIERVWEYEDFDLAHKMQLRDLINLVASIADKIERVSDRMNIMIVKRKL